MENVTWKIPKIESIGNLCKIINQVTLTKHDKMIYAYLLHEFTFFSWARLNQAKYKGVTVGF